MGGGFEQFRSVQQGLRGHAADVQAGAAEYAARFDDSGFQAKLAGTNGRIIATGTTTDDHYVEIVVSHAKALSHKENLLSVS